VASTVRRKYGSWLEEEEGGVGWWRKKCRGVLIKDLGLSVKVEKSGGFNDRFENLFERKGSAHEC